MRAHEIVKEVPHTEVRSWTSRKASIFFIASGSYVWIGEGEAGYKFCWGKDGGRYCWLQPIAKAEMTCYEIY